MTAMPLEIDHESGKPVPPRRARRLLQQAREAAASFSNRLFADMYIYAVEQYLEGESAFLDFMGHLERPPVSIEVFLDSPDFIGATDLTLWPEVRKAIIDINKDWWRGPRYAVQEALLMGATSTGKSEIAKITICYHLYLLSCLRVPQTVYGLPRTTPIVFVIQAAKPHVTKKVLYVPLRKMIEEIPYFQTYMRPNTLIESEMYFEEKNIRIVPGGSDTDAILGEAIIGAIIDEINFMAVVQRSRKAEVTMGRPGMYDQAEAVYGAVSRRKRSRFTYQGPQIGVVIPSSSTRYRGDFTDRRKANVVNHAVHSTFIYHKKQYEVWPKERYSGETFPVLVANDALAQSRILTSDERVPDSAWVEAVPVEYLDDFRHSINDALRDIVGVSDTAIMPFIRKRHKIMECVEIAETMGLESFLVKDNVVLGLDGMPQVKHGHYCKNPSKPRYVHIDLAVSGDRCAVAMIRFEGLVECRRGDGQVELLPRGVVELACSIEPDSSNEIQIAEVRTWVRLLRTVYGYPIKAVTYDGWNCVSRFTRIWTNRGLLYAHEVMEGDVVQTRSGPQPVEKVWRYGKAPTVVVTTQHGHSLEMTYNHKIEVLERWEWDTAGNRLPVWVWCKAGQLQEGDVVRIWREKTQVDVEQEYPLHPVPDKYVKSNSVYGVSLTLNPALARFLGLMWGDGHFYFNGFSITCTEEEAPEVCRLVEDAFELENPVFWRRTRSACYGTVTVGSQHVMDWLKHNGLCDKSDIPVAIRRSPLHVQAAFISGLLAADGSVKERDGQISIEQVNESYIDYMMDVLVMGFGLSVNKTYRKPRKVRLPQGRIHDTQGSYILQINGRREDFIEKIGFAIDCKMAQAEHHIDRPGRCIFSKIKSIKESSCDVMDFQVAEDHSYLANGFVSHNSQESRQQWRKEGMRTAQISVDRTSVPYKHMRDGIYDTRIIFAYNDVLIDELTNLEYDEIKDKIDHPVKGCFTGDTRVALLDGTNPTFEELGERYGDGRMFPVYSMSPEGITVGWAHSPRVTKQDALILEVTLNNYQVIRCTPDHLFMTLDGEWVQAQYLTSDVRLMPLYRVRSHKGGWAGYEKFWCPVRQQRLLTHHMVAQVELGDISREEHVHHKNEDKGNNHPGNLVIQSRRAHLAYHTKKRHRYDPDYVLRLRAGHKYYREHGGNERSRENINRLFDEGILKRGREVCIIEGCARLCNAKGMCDMHYQRVRRKKNKQNRTAKQKNHWVLSVRPLAYTKDVWDITVEEYHNFALTSGVFVHNSKDLADAVCGAYHTMITRKSSWVVMDDSGRALRPDFGDRPDGDRPD